MLSYLHDGRVEPPSESSEGRAFREHSSPNATIGRLLLAVSQIMLSLILALMTAAAAG